VFVNNHGSNVKIIDPLLRRIRYETGAFVALSKLYAERYLGLISDVMENPPEETPGWHSSELEPVWFPDSFIKLDGAPEVEFQGYQYFLFPTDHADFTPSGVIGNPFRATAEKGETTYELYAEHLAAALEEFQKVPVEVHTREWRDRA
jgi:creatinine amidohydrolase